MKKFCERVRKQFNVLVIIGAANLIALMIISNAPALAAPVINISTTSGPFIYVVSAFAAAEPTHGDVPKWLKVRHANIATFTSTTSGSWGNPATWGGAGVPGPNDDVTISSGTSVMLDTNRASHNLTIRGQFFGVPAGTLELNGNRFDIQGNGAIFTLDGVLANSSSTYNTVNFVGDGTPGSVTQFLQSNSGCSFANLCNLQLRLSNAVTVKNIAGRQFFNIGLTIDPSTVLDLTDDLLFIGSFQSFIPINNSGSIQNGRLTTERLVTISNSGTFDSVLVVDDGTTQTQGDLNRLVAVQAFGTLRLTGALNLHADVTINSGGNLDINGNAMQFLGNNATILNQSTISNSGVANTIYFAGNGTAEGVTQRLSTSNSGTFANNITERCYNTVRLVLDGDAQFGNLVIDSGSTLDLANHTLRLTGPGLGLTVNGTILTAGSSIEMRGTAPQSIQTNLNGAAYNNLTINNAAGANIPNPGANPLTVLGTLTLAAGIFSPNGNLTMGSGATIARSEGSLAGPPLFGSTINIRYFGFTSVSSGAEIPLANIVNNLSVDTVSMTTATLNSDVVVNGNLFVAQGGTLTGSVNRSLELKGPTVTNVGTVSVPAVKFNSSGIQTIGVPSGAWTGASLTMAGTGSVSLANGATFANAAFTNASNINTGTNFLSFKGAVFTNRGVINGNVQTMESNVVLDAATTGFNAALRVFSGITTAKGTINSSLIIQSSDATLQVSAGEMLTVTGDSTMNGPLNGGGTFKAIGSTVNNNALVSIAAFQLAGAAQLLAGTGTFSGNAVTILSGSSATLGANKQMNAIAINAGGSLNLANRTLFLSGAGSPLTNAGSFSSSTSTVEYNGATVQTLSTTIPAYFNLSLNNRSGTAGFAGMTVSGLLRVKAGTFRTGGSTFKDIQIDNGATFAGRNATSMNVSGNWTNNGAFTANGNIINFSGAGNQLLGGTSGTMFDNLMTSGGTSVNLGQNVSVNGVLTLGGDLITGANTLLMPSTGTSIGTADVIGNVKRSGFVGGGAALSFGNSFNTIAFEAVGTLPSDITFNLVKSLHSGFPSSVRRIYTITPTGGSGFSATLRLHYLDGELNGNPEPNLKLFRFTETWVLQGATASDITDNWVEQSGVTQFSPWVFGATVKITGRVTTPDGRSIRNATVSLTDSQASRRTATTSSFGYYVFDEVAVGEYTIGVSSKRYRFASRVLTINDNLSEANFEGLE